MIVILRKYPLHKLGGFFSSVGWQCWARGILLHAGGERGLLVAWVRREKDTTQRIPGT